MLILRSHFELLRLIEIFRYWTLISLKRSPFYLYVKLLPLPLAKLYILRILPTMSFAQNIETSQDFWEDVVFPPSDLLSDEPPLETDLVTENTLNLLGRLLLC